MHHHDQQQPQRVHHDVPLASHHLFAPVKAPVTADFRGFDALTIDDRRTRFGIPPVRCPEVAPQVGVDALPGAIVAPGAEVIVDGGPRREVTGQHAPLTTGAQFAEERIDHDTRLDSAGSAGAIAGRDKRRNHRPLGIGSVRGVAADWWRHFMLEIPCTRHASSIPTA